MADKDTETRGPQQEGRQEHRRMECKLNCPLDNAGKCSEHKMLKWLIGVILTIGVIVVGFSWRTYAVVNHSVLSIEKQLSVAIYAQRENHEMIKEIRLREIPPPLFRSQVERLEQRVQKLEDRSP